MLPLVFINLDDADERRVRMQAQISKLPLHSKRLPAIRWANLSSIEQDRLYSLDLNKRQYYQPLTGGEKGCYASHISAWHELLSTEAPALIVLEDDVILTESFYPVIESIIKLRDSWDMVKLMGRHPKEKIYRKKKLNSTHKLIQYKRVPSHTAGYVVSRTGCKKLLGSRKPFGRPIDVDLRFWWENDMRILGVWPPVVRLDVTDNQTTITGRSSASTLSTPWRKIAMKTRLTLGNYRHLREQ